MTDHTSKKHPHWSREEFVAFLLLDAADADMACTQEERVIIKAGIDESHLASVEAEYNSLKDYEKISVIKSYKSQYYNDPTRKSDLLKIVEQLFQADGEFDIMEHNLYRMLQKIL